MNLATAVAATVGARALVTRLAGTVVGGDPRALAGRPALFIFTALSALFIVHTVEFF